MIPLTEEQKQRMECSDRFTYIYEQHPDPEELQNADVIIGNPKPQEIAASARLKLLQLASSGADVYVKPGILRPGTMLASATGAYSQAVAEHAFAMTLCLIKKLHLYRDDQVNTIWTDQGKVGSLRGATVLIVGMGDIGMAYARMVKAMGSYVIGVRRRPAQCPDCADELFVQKDIDSLLPRADVVCSILPGTQDTFHLFCRETFCRMKKTAVFINVGRGSAQDEAALSEALENGIIAAAGIDVTEKEPLDKASKLWGLKNLLITPHVAGGNHMDETVTRIADICIENFTRYVHGNSLQNEIDFETGYRK